MLDIRDDIFDCLARCRIQLSAAKIRLHFLSTVLRKLPSTVCITMPIVQNAPVPSSLKFSCGLRSRNPRDPQSGLCPRLKLTFLFPVFRSARYAHGNRDGCGEKERLERGTDAKRCRATGDPASRDVPPPQSD